MSDFDKIRVVGLDADEMLGYFSLLTQIGGIVELIVGDDHMNAFVRSFAHELWISEQIGKTRFFRPGISDFIQELAYAFHSGKINRVFILSNNPSNFMLNVIAEVINFYANPDRTNTDLISKKDVFSLKHPGRMGDRKSLSTIQTCLGMKHILPKNLIFFDDIEQMCKFEECKFVLVKKYEYVTPIRAITCMFFAELRKFDIDMELLKKHVPEAVTADDFAEKVMDHWTGYLRNYMRRGMSLSKDDEHIPGVKHKDLKDTFVFEHMIPAFREWLGLTAGAGIS